VLICNCDFVEKTPWREEAEGAIAESVGRL
jgi:hypothetical protein